MIIDLLYFISFFSFFFLTIGFLIKDKTLTYIGSTILLLLGLILIVPESYTGGIELVTGSSTNTTYEYLNYTLEFVPENITVVPNYQVANSTTFYSVKTTKLISFWANAIGIILIGISIYLILTTYLERIG